MSNKETLQNYNATLNANNLSLETVLNAINELPEAKEPELQDKEVTPTTETQNITSDEGYDGLSEVIVNPIPDEYVVPKGTLDITENGEKDVTSYSSVNVNVAGSGGGGLGQPFPIIKASSTIFVQGALDSMTSYSITLPDPYYINDANPNLALIFWFARSKCSISDNVTVIYEGEPVDYNGGSQSLHIGYTTYEQGKTITITQESSVRLGIGYIPLCNAGIPIIVGNQVITMNGDYEYTLNTDENLNVYILTNAYTTDTNYDKNLYYLAPIGYPTGWSSRLCGFITTCPIKDAKVTFKQMFYGDVVQIKCPAKVYE